MESRTDVSLWVLRSFLELIFCITAPVGCFCYYLQFILIVFNILLSKENAFKVRNGNVKIYFIKNKQKILSIIILISTSNIALIILKVNYTTLREKCIRSFSGLYLVRMRKKADQTTSNTDTFQAGPKRYIRPCQILWQSLFRKLLRNICMTKSCIIDIIDVWQGYNYVTGKG